MPSPPSREDSATMSENREERERNIERDREQFAADNAPSPSESLGLGEIGSFIATAAIPGLGAIDAAHGIAQAIGGGLESLFSSLGLETTAPAISSGLSSLSPDRDRGRDGIERANAVGGLTQVAGLPPGLPDLNNSPLGISNQIIMQAGMEKIAEMLGIGGDDEKEEQEEKTSSTEKKADSSPTQATAKPVQEAAEEREAGRTNLEQLFLDLINGKLDIKV